MRRDLSNWLVNLRTFGRKAKYRRGNRSLQARRASASISLAGGEQLDPRKMLAVTANLVGSGLAISLGAADDVAGLVYNTTTDEYDVYDKTTLVDSFKASGVSTIEVIDTAAGGGEDQVFEIRDGGTIAASLGVSNGVETTKIFDDISVTSADPIPGGFGVVIGSAKIILDDATLANPLAIGTNNSDIQFDGVVTLIGGTDANINSGADKGDIDFLGNILGGEDGAGTLTLSAGTGVLTFGGTIGGEGEDEALGGVLISSAKSVSATGKFYLDGTLPTAYDAGLTVADGVNDVNLSNGGEITGFGEDAGIYFRGSSTNSTVSQFKVFGNDTGMVFGGGIVGNADLSGTVVNNNEIYDNEDDGIDLYGVRGNLDGEDAFVIGGTKTGNIIHGNGYDGIYGVNSTGVEILGNAIYDNGFISGGAGINLEEGGEYLIQGNTIGEDGLVTSLGNAVNGITIDGGEDGAYSYAGTVIRGNTIEFNREYGVRIQGVTADTGEDAILVFDNEILYNGFALVPGVPTDIGGVRIDGSENIRILFNAINNNGEDATGNGIDIVNGSHGTVVFSNSIIDNINNGVYVENSSTLLNPVLIGDVLPVTASTGTTLTVEGDQRAFIVVGQLVTRVIGTDVKSVTVDSAEVLGIAYDADADETTLTFTSVSGTYSAVSLGNYIAGNGEDGVGNGINVLATGADASAVVKGLEILGNVIVSNEQDGIRMEATRAAVNADLSDILIAGNFIGRDPTAVSPADAGNGEDGIEIINGNSVEIVQNYIAGNGGAASFANDYNGIEIRTSLNIAVGGEGEDGTSFGNYIVRNANDGVNVKGSDFVEIVNNEIANNGEDGIKIESFDGRSSNDILVENNLIYANASQGVAISDSNRVTVLDNLIQYNGNDGVAARDSDDVYVGFNTIRYQGEDNDGVSFFRSTGVIEGNEIYNNGTGVYVNGDGSYNGLVDVLGNIIRDNSSYGVDFAPGDYSGEDSDGARFSIVGGNTIESNGIHGVDLDYVAGVQVGGVFPSQINFINLNGEAGVQITGSFNDVLPTAGPVGPYGVFVLGNEIESNGEYGVQLNSAEDVIVGGGYVSDGIDGTTLVFGPEAANTIRRNGIAGVFAQGESFQYALVANNDISENPIGVMITSASGFSPELPFGAGLAIGGPDSLGEDGLGTFANRIFNNGEGVRATGDSYGTVVAGNIIEGNLTGATLASVRGLTFGYGESFGEFATGWGNIVQDNNEGVRASGLLTGTVVAGNAFIDNTKVGIALQSARDLTVGGFFGEDSANFVTGSPVGLSASGTMTDTLVAFNEFDANTIGIALSKATGMTVGGNEIANSLKYGISVTGNNADTLIVENLITNTGDGPYAGSGIYLNGARNVDIIDNTLDGSSLAGLYATGNTSGTVVQGNLFTDNRIGMFLENASNAVFGGIGEDEGNTIIGGGDPLAGEYRDGILVVGGAPGSSITGTDITDASTGVWLRESQGIEITDTFVTGAKFYGFNASGNLTGSSFHDNVITNTVGIAGGLGHAINLEGAQNLAVYNNLGEDSFGSGLYVTGNTAATTVENNVFDGNRVGISLVNATNAVIGGLGEDEGNLVIGGSDAANGIYRDGISVLGTSTGSSLKGTEISDVTTGATLENATGVLVENNTITGAEFLGVNASGTLTGSEFKNNTVSGTGGLGALGHGIYLANALGLSITDNLVENSSGGGLYATGSTTGTTVYNNDLNGNRVGIYLVNATNASIGDDGAGEDNRIVGGGNASKGDFRDGIVASGVSTGSSVRNVSITNAATGITLSAATALTIASANVTGSQVFGLNANGLLTGTKVQTSTFELTTSGAGGGAGVLLSAAQSLEITDATISKNVIGLLATGNCAGSSVIDTTWDMNTTQLINNSTGVPALDIDPLPPA